MKYLKKILFFIFITSSVVVFSQATFSRVVYYESSVNQKTLTDYLNFGNIKF